MPRIKSAVKRVQVAERNRVRNRAWKTAVRTVRTELAQAVGTADSTKAGSALQNAYKVIDRAVAKGVLHRNAAARRKSRLAKQVLKVGGTTAKATKAKAEAKPAKSAKSPAKAK